VPCYAQAPREEQLLTAGGAWPDITSTSLVNSLSTAALAVTVLAKRREGSVISDRLEALFSGHESDI
jgi:hypothetical protein